MDIGSVVRKNVPHAVKKTGHKVRNEYIDVLRGTGVD